MEERERGTIEEEKGENPLCVAGNPVMYIRVACAWPDVITVG